MKKQTIIFFLKPNVPLSSITNDATFSSKVVEASSSSSFPSFSSFPKNIIMSFLAFISRFYFSNLSFISKSFHSLLSYLGIYKPQSHLETKQFIYICLWFPTYKSPSWFSLLMNPNQALTGYNIKEKARENFVVPLPCSQSFPISKPIVAVGSKIYVLGGAIDDLPSSAVRVLDCRSHTWHAGPSMKIARKDSVLGVLNGKIYVFGGCNVNESKNWAEVFDTKTQTWETLPRPPREVRRSFIKKMVAFEGKFYVDASRGVSYVYVYDPEEGTWEYCGCEHNNWMIDRRDCYVVKNVLYRYGSFWFDWYDMESRKWRNVKGLEELQSKFHSSGGLRVRAMFEAKYGGKLVIFWDGVGLPKPSRTRKRNIWCAEIAFERRHEDEIWGKLEWVDVVLTVPNAYNFMRCLAISV